MKENTISAWIEIKCEIIPFFARSQSDQKTDLTPFIPPSSQWILVQNRGWKLVASLGGHNNSKWTSSALSLLSCLMCYLRVSYLLLLCLRERSGTPLSRLNLVVTVLEVQKLFCQSRCHVFHLTVQLTSLTQQGVKLGFHYLLCIVSSLNT